MKKYIISILLLVSVLAVRGEVLTLDSCLSYARQRNCTIQSALLDVQIAQQVKKQVFTKYFPQVSLTAFGFYAIDPLVRIYIPGLMPTEEGEQSLEEIFDALREEDPNISPNMDLLKCQW